MVAAAEVVAVSEGGKEWVDARVGAPTSAVSRPSMANRARAENQAAVTDFLGKRSQPITVRDGVKLRREAVIPEARANCAISWKGLIKQWRMWYEDRRNAGLVFEKDGEQCTGPQENRFMPSYSNKLYAKLKDLERGLHDAYGRRFHTGMLTLTASAGRPGEWVAPVDQLDELLSSWEAVRRALHRVLDDSLRWERLMVLEPHKSGYVHAHIAVFVDGGVDAETFEPVIDAHLRNCELAERDAHEYENVIDVKRVAGSRDRELDEIGNLGSYLAEYLGMYDEDPLDAPEHVQAFNALLWATGRQRWRPSNGAQRYMAYDSSLLEPEWDLVGVTYDGGETVEPLNPQGGGVEWAETWSDWPPPN